MSTLLRVIEMMRRRFTMWHPFDKGADCALSNDNMTATFSGTVFQLVRATASKSTGKWYWEVTWNSGTNLALGVASKDAAVSSWLGIDTNGWSVMAVNGFYYYNNATVSSAFASMATGDVYGVELDLTAGTMRLRKNNVASSNTLTGITGTVYPSVSVFNGGCAATVNFGKTAFVYSVPAGFTAWDPV